MKYIVILICILLSDKIIIAQSESNSEFLYLIKDYPVDTLPFHTNFSDETKSNIENYVFQENQAGDNDSKKDSITSTMVRKYLFGGKNYVRTQNLWSGDSIGIDSINNYLTSNKFYLVSVPIKSQKFVGIVFRRDAESGSEIIFCTFNKEGELISKVQLGFYMHAGSYTTEDGGRAPWYAEKRGWIDKDFTIDTDDGQSKTRKFQISATGMIIAIK